MKRSILLSIIILFTSNIVKAQNEFYNALSLKPFSKYNKLTGVEIVLDSTNISKVYSILDKYLTDDQRNEIIKTCGKKPTRSCLAQNLVIIFNDNPFFSISTTGHDADRIYGKGFITKESISEIGSSLGNFNVTTIADGAAKFLVERVKEELSMSFFNQFKSDLEHNKDLQILFPNTYNALQSIDTEIYNFTAYLGMIREAFISDFQIIIPDFRKLMDDPRYADYFKNNKKLKSLFFLGLQFGEDLQFGAPPGEMIKHLAEMDSASLAEVNVNLKPSLEVLNLFIQSLRSTSPDHYLVTTDSISDLLLKDNISLRLYLGLIYIKGAGISFSINGKPNDFDSILKEGYQNVQKVTAFLNRTSEILKELSYREQVAEKMFKEIKEKNKNSDPSSQANYKDYYAFYDACLNLAEYVTDIPKLLNEPPVIYLDKDKCFFVARKIGSIYLDINQKRYASAIMNMAIVYDSLFINQNDKFKGQLLKYGNFASIVAKAETSDEVKAAIETVALPAGSASIKKNTQFNISLNAYVGGFYGNEYLPENKLKSTANSFGISAPIGIAFSLPLHKGNCGSISLFGSIIDIGSFASYRLKDTSSAPLPEIKLQNIFAPGGALIYGVPKWPLSVGFMYQWGPALREISSQGAKINSGKLNHRWLIFVAVDIPILNFYSKPRY